jgi:hypothetical protein
MLTDLRDAVRQLRKAPGFTTTALITLALVVSDDFQQENMIATLTTLFGVLALCLLRSVCMELWHTRWNNGPARLAFAWRWERIACGS